MEEKKSFGNLIDAAKSGDMDQVKNLLNSKKYSYSTINNALIEAEQNGHDEVASWLRQYMQKCMIDNFAAAMKAQEKERVKAKEQENKRHTKKAQCYDIGDD